MMKGTNMLILCILISCGQVSAKVTGSWTKKSNGGVLSVGNQIMRSQSISSPQQTPDKATVERISWQISLLRSPPMGLEIKLCISAACVQLYSLSGSFVPDRNWQAKSEYRFLYTVHSNRALRPALHVVCNNLTINYTE